MKVINHPSCTARGTRAFLAEAQDASTVQLIRPVTIGEGIPSIDSSLPYAKDIWKTEPEGRPWNKQAH